MDKMNSQKNAKSSGMQPPCFLLDRQLVGWFAIWLPFVCLLVWVFRDQLFGGMALWGADNPYHNFISIRRVLPAGFFGVWWSGQLFGSSGQPVHMLLNGFLIWLLPEKLSQAGTYLADTLLVGVATYLFLRGRKAERFAALLGGTALAFSGYSFTLISAGHLGNFGMMPFAIFSLAAADRGVEKRSLVYYVLAGACAGVGLNNALDVMFLFGVMIAAYTCFRIWEDLRRDGNRIRRLAIHAAGCSLAALVCIGVANTSLLYGFKEAVPGRQNIAGGSEDAAYEFATNWSMPPEEILEFVAPCIYGVETAHPSAPYWGRLGQSLGWPETRRGLANLRQHTVYLGVLPLAFATYALWWAWRFRKRGVLPPDSSEGNGSRRREVFFWSGLWVVSLILALGRFTPVYRVFFSLPYCSSIRCPVKFLHLTEVATAVLFGIGIDIFMKMFGLYQNSTSSIQQAAKGDANQIKRKALLLGVILFGAGVIFLLGSLFVLQPGRSWEAAWTAMGLDRLADNLRKNMAGSFVHAGLMFLAASLAVVSAAWFGRRRFSMVWAVGIYMLLALDLGMVVGRYINVFNPNSVYRSDAIVEKLRADNEPYRVSCPVKDALVERWSFVFPYWSIEVFDPGAATSVLPAGLAEYFGAFSNNVLRMWQLAGVKYIAGPTGAYREMSRHPSFSPVMAVDARRDLWTSVPVAESTHVLLMNRSVLPRALVFHNWEGLDREHTLTRIGDATWNPLQSVLVPPELGSRTNSLEPLDGVQIVEHSWRRVRLRTAMRLEGILLLNEKYDSSWKAYLNGRDTPTFVCNGMVKGVFVPPGPCEVVFEFDSPYRAGAILENVIFVGAVVAWALVELKRKGVGAGHQGLCES